MAAGTYSPTTSETDMVEVWRKVQSDLMEGFNFMAEEYELLDSVERFRVDWSVREILVPIDLNFGYGVASIPEGGYEAMPSSPSVEELSLDWILLNKRFTATLTAQYIDQRNAEAMVRRQILFQGKKAIEAIGDRFSNLFYGLSDGVSALCSAAQGANTSHTITLIDGYGQSDIDNAGYLARMFQVGDRVALINTGALVTNAIGTITAKSAATPSITVTWNGSVTITANDEIVLANSQENTSLSGTDYNRGLVGLLEVTTAASVHGLATATNAQWDVAYSDSAAGRWHTVDLLNGQDAIADFGGGSLNTLVMARGVYRDVVDNQLSNLRFTDAFQLEVDGEAKVRSTTIFRSKRVPNGYVFGFDKASYRKLTLLPKPVQGGTPVWGDGQKIVDRSARVFSIDFPVALVCLNRANFALWSGKTEQ
jgi:hypothetical protein